MYCCIYLRHCVLGYGQVYEFTTQEKDRTYEFGFDAMAWCSQLRRGDRQN